MKPFLYDVAVGAASITVAALTVRVILYTVCRFTPMRPLESGNPERLR